MRGLQVVGGELKGKGGRGASCIGAEADEEWLWGAGSKQGSPEARARVPKIKVSQEKAPR